MMRLIQFVVILLLISCGDVNSALEGGIKDTQAPRILDSNLCKTNFNQREINIEFDEYIDLNNPEKNIKIFPEHSTLKFQVSKKKLSIKFDSLLKPNTTYFLKINGGIKDIHEGNVFNYDYLFSTGSIIDTGIINVSIRNFKAFKGLKIALLSTQATDSLRNFNSGYTQDVNSNQISFKGLKKEIYYCWIFTDNDQNKKPDLYNPIAFSSSLTPDTTVELTVYNWLNKLKIKKTKSDGEYLKILYDNNPDYNIGLELLYPSQYKNLIYANEDSALFEYFDCGTKPDSVKSIDAYAELHQIILRSLKKIEGTNFYIQYMLPQFYQNAVGYTKLENTKVSYPKEVSRTLLYVPRLEEIDTLEIKDIASIEEQKLSMLTIHVNDSTNKKFDLKILKEDKIVYYTSNKKDIEIFLDPGTYTIEISESENEHKIDPINLINGPRLIYSKTLNLKASWEEIQTINL